MKFYMLVFGVLLVVVFVIYMAGVHNGNEKCRNNVADNVLQQHKDMIYLEEKINAETLHTATDDIRDILREKYTIAE